LTKPFAIEGIDLSTAGSIAYAEQPNGPDLKLLLNAALTDNANYVEIGGLGTINLTTGVVNASQTVPLSDIASAAASAEADGLTVMFDPILVATTQSSYATSLENPNATFDAPAFFAGYQAYIVKCAKTAQAAGVKIFSIGSEMRAVTGSQYTSYWDQIIAAVRKVYSGELTYKADFEPGYPAGNEAAQIGFWNELDLVSLDVYPVLGTQANPTLGQLGAAWTSGIEDGQPVDYAQAVASIAQETGKPILIAETGVASMNAGEEGPAIDYLISQPETQANYALQANWWRAFFNTFAANPPSWLEGVMAFGMDPDVDGDDRTTPYYYNSYSLYKKPAETVIADWFGGKGDLANSTNDFTGANQSEVLIQNGSGTVKVGNLSGGRFVYTQIGGLGPDWTFHGSGDFLGDGMSSFLLHNSDGAVAVGEVVNGKARYTKVGELGPRWSFVGVGDFLGDAQDQFLIENSSGVLEVGEVGANDQATYIHVGELGPQWSFVGAGDFLGDGQDQFLIENSSGAVSVGEIGPNDRVTYAHVGTLGPKWTFQETGDFLGDGQTDFLIENTFGAVAVGEVVNGQAVLTTVAGLGPQWHFVGAGDYFGTGIDSFLIENTAGAIVAGTVVAGKAQFTRVGELGPQWTFHG